MPLIPKEIDGIMAKLGTSAVVFSLEKSREDHSESAPLPRESLAINLFDLDRVDPLVRATLLAGNVDLSRAIVVDKSRLDEAAVAFTCNLLQAACIADIVRSHDRKVKDYPTRVYLRKASGKAWNKLPGHAALALVIDGILAEDNAKCRLNPEFFAVPASPPVPPSKVRTVSLGMNLGEK